MKNNKEESLFDRLKKNKAAMAGMTVLSVFVLTAICADFISPYSEGIRQNSSERLNWPSAAHPFGTDNFGRDVFTRIIHGARFSIALGLSTITLAMTIALILGSAAGYFGGRLDEIIMRIMDTIMCIPSILLSLAIVTVLGPGLLNLMIAIAVGSVPSFTRLIRSVVLTITESDYIEAAKAAGSGHAKIIFTHVIRNALGPLIVYATTSIAGMILMAAGFSFIGLGVRPPAPEWGAMLADARENLRRAPYLMVFPGVSILLTALSFNLLGDGLRDALDPRLKA
jgi:peptide/nickel transport system permease protein